MPLKSWILYAFLQPTDWPSKDFGTIFNHFASGQGTLADLELQQVPDIKATVFSSKI